MLRVFAIALCLVQLASGYVPALLLTQCCGVPQPSQSAATDSPVAQSSTTPIAPVTRHACCQHAMACDEAPAPSSPPAAKAITQLHCCLDPYGLFNHGRKCPIIDAADPDRAITAAYISFDAASLLASVIALLPAPSTDVSHLAIVHCAAVNPSDSPHFVPPDRQILHCSYQC
ncbi:MAG: hypothetical protein C0478_03870 [Planctomyces sp.]|nr:hypothetical protein [Planctomyces sp.]